MTDDLIKRAREDDTDPVMLRQMADTLEAQAAEIARLREALACQTIVLETPLEIDAYEAGYQDALEAQAAEIERLETALRGLLANNTSKNREVARAALEDKP